jgi:hypothetical protein
VLHIFPERKNHVDDDGRPHGKKGNVDKPKANFAGGQPQSFANGSANAKCLPFNKPTKVFHEGNLIIFQKIKPIFCNFAVLHKKPTGILPV